MLRLIALAIIGGHFQWQIFKDQNQDHSDGITIVFQLGDAVDLATVLSERYKAQALKELEKLLIPNNITWIQPGHDKWILDLQALTVAFDLPDLKSLDWLKGVVPLKADHSFKERRDMGNQRYQSVVQFKISPDLLKAINNDEERLKEAYGIISHLEQSLRSVIETKLRMMHGEHWWKRGVPEQVRTDCEQRKKDKEKPGEAGHHPINYAYVDNYKTIIVKRDNWDTVFQAAFGDRTKVEASFSWVAKVRDAIAHTRPIADDDYRMFAASAYWLQSAIDRA